MLKDADNPHFPKGEVAKLRVEGNHRHLNVTPFQPTTVP
jgi:hypothetical protein